MVGLRPPPPKTTTPTQIPRKERRPHSLQGGPDCVVIMIMKNLLLVPLALLPAACATSSAAADGTRDPAYEKAQRDKWNRYRTGRLNAQDRVRRGRLMPQEIGRVLLDCDALLRDYFESRKAPGNTRVESFIVSVRKALWQLVAANFPRIMIAAEDTKYGQNRAVAPRRPSEPAHPPAASPGPAPGHLRGVLP